MKNLFFVIATIICFQVFSSCNQGLRDAIKNEFTYDGTTYALSKGFLSDVGPNLSGSHDWDIFLTSESIDKSEFSLTGQGEIVYLDLNTDSGEGLKAGTYNWSDVRGDLTIVPGSELFVDYNLATFSGTKINFTDGTVDISILGITTTIIFNLTTADGKTLTGEWEGRLQDF